MPKFAVPGALVVLASATFAAAHDYWLQPQRFHLSPGDATPVRLFVGDRFDSEAERPFQDKMTVDFRLIARDRVTDLKAAARDGEKPAATMVPRRAGSHLVVMERDWSRIEIEAAKFSRYLEHEGLSQILELRRRADEDKTPGRERYRRYLKALIQVGDETDATYKRKVGHRLEFLPHVNPCQCSEGDPIGVTVLFEGKPLPDAQVEAFHRDGDETRTQQARTDDEGRVRFTLDRSGLWLIRLVHMQRCRNVRGIDWESFWAAYSFQLK